MKTNLVLCLCLSGWISLASAVMPGVQAQEIGQYEFGEVGAPKSDGALKFDLTIMVKGRPVTKEVKVENIKKLVVPKPAEGEGLQTKTYKQKLWNAYGEASQAKSKLIVDAINKKFETEFAALKVTASVGVKNVTSPNLLPNTKFDSFFGTVVVPSVANTKDGPFKWIANGILGEGTDKGRFTGTGSSAGLKASIEPLDPGRAAVAVGIDPMDDPSVVEFGIDEIYVAQFFPTSGMTDVDILKELERLLDLNGLPATFDPSFSRLTLDVPVLDGQALAWSNTDPGLDFLISTEGSASANVPDSGSTALLSSIMILLVVQRARKRPATLPE